MGLFKNILKGAGNVIKKVGQVAGTVLKVASPALTLIPVVGPLASKIVDKLPLGTLEKVDKAVQSSAIQHVIQAATAPAASRPEALVLAKEAKLDILSSTGNALLADQVGQATYEAAAAPQLPQVHVNDLAKVLAEATAGKSPVVGEKPASAEDRAASSSLLKDVLKGALDGAKEGAINAAAETPMGEQLKKDAINAQVNKYLPFALAGALAYFIIKKK